MPVVFRGYMQREMGEDGSTEGLTQAAIAEVGVALCYPRQDRSAAFHLLASDAYASYACEAASQADAVEPALLRILAAVQVTGD